MHQDYSAANSSAGMLRFGVHSGQQYRSFADCVALWRRVESLGYDWISCFDHFRPPIGGPTGPCFEGTTLLAALAARTVRIRCAMLVSSVTWRHPAIAAAAAATIDHVSGGRLEFGLGLGGPDLAYGQYGLPFPPVATRSEMLDEACRILRGLWTGEPFTFHGKHFHLTDACLEPKPLQTRLPLVVGGAAKRTLRIAAEHADVWNTLAGAPDDYRRTVDTLERRCAEVGRPGPDVRRSITFRAVLAEKPEEAALRRAERLAMLPAGSPDVGEYLVFGTPQEAVETLLEYARLGVRDFLLGCRPPLDWQTIELFATEVAPVMRAELRA